MKNKSMCFLMAERKAKRSGEEITPDAALNFIKKEYKGKFDLLLPGRISEMIYELLKATESKIDAAEIQTTAYKYFGG